MSQIREHTIKSVRTLYQRYAKHTDILPGLFKHSLETLEKKPTKYLNRWIQLIEPVKDFVQTQDHRRPGMDIRRYLPMMEKPPEEKTGKNKGEQDSNRTEGVTSTQKNR